MTFKELYELALSRAGDYEYFEHGTPTVADLARVKIEVNTAYADAMNILAEAEVFPQYEEGNVTFAAGVQEVDLYDQDAPVVLTYRPRRVLYVGVYPNADTTKDPQDAIFPAGGSRTRARAGRKLATSKERSMYMRGYRYLGFVTLPTAAQIVQVGYAPVVETLVSDTDVPAQLPDEHHEYIAQMAAYNLVSNEPEATRGLAPRLGVLTSRLNDAGPSINRFKPRVVPMIGV